jgi:hypothetical protein
MKLFVIFLLAVALSQAQSPTAPANAIVFAGGGYQLPPLVLDVAPGQIVTLHVHGITAAFDSNLTPVAGPSGYPLELNLTVTFTGPNSSAAARSCVAPYGCAT